MWKSILAEAVSRAAQATEGDHQDLHYEAIAELVASSLAHELKEQKEHALGDFTGEVFRAMSTSKAQLFQDLWVLFETKGKRDGYFVEFGASDGVKFSNTFLLEKEFAWTGILAEPNPMYQDNLVANRSCHVTPVCVFPGEAGKRQFRCTKDGMFSTLSDFAASDLHYENFRKRDYIDIEVPTIALDKLLESHDAPRTIDYLSVDTEGSELAILQAFPFDQWQVKLITVEHNYSGNRAPIHDLLVTKHYRRKFEAYSKWDDWYVLDEIA